MNDFISQNNPFLPDGRQWAWNSSTLGPAKECSRKYYYKVRLGLQQKSYNADITFGGHYANALEQYHKNRTEETTTHQMALRGVIRTILQNTWDKEADKPWESGHNLKTRETLIRSVIWYLDQFENDPCHTVQLEDRPAVELPFRFQIADDIWLTGHIDRLIEFAGDHYVQDQKTTGASLGSYYFKRYTPDNQMSLYTVAAEVVWHTPVRGVMIDAAQIAVGFTRFERGFAFRSPDQTSEWLRDAEYHIRETWRAEEAGWPMNDTACSKFGGCEFRDVCSKSPSVRKEFLGTGFVKAFRNPLGEH